jgi:hypothetical protein
MAKQKIEDCGVKRWIADAGPDRFTVKTSQIEQAARAAFITQHP